MRKLYIILAGIIAALSLTSCEVDYYEPVFGYDNLPSIIPAEGGVYSIEYDYQYFATKSISENFEWEYRLIVDGYEVDSRIIKEYGSGRHGYRFLVDIGPNFDPWPRSIVVEASTHVDMGYEEWWGDWTPICTAVQMPW